MAREGAGQVLDMRAEDDRREELARLLGPLRRGLEPALGGREAGRQQPRSVSAGLA